MCSEEVPILGSLLPLLGMKVKLGESVIWLIKMDVSTNMPFCQELSINMIADMLPSEINHALPLFCLHI